jgi:hypothetical protein
MNMCWKYLVPASFGCALFVALWMLITHAVPVLEKVVQGAMFVMGVGLIVAFALRTLKNLRDVGDRFDVTSNW